MLKTMDESESHSGWVIFTCLIEYYNARLQDLEWKRARPDLAVTISLNDSLCFNVHSSGPISLHPR